MILWRDGREYVKCELCHRFATFDNAVRLGWDWFTGTRSRTYHYCREHKTSEERNTAMKEAGVRP